MVLAALIIATGGCLAAVAVQWPGDQHGTTKEQRSPWHIFCIVPQQVCQLWTFRRISFEKASIEHDG
jgi:hypothetical protein